MSERLALRIYHSHASPAKKKRKGKGRKMALFICKRKMDGRGFGKSDNGRSDKKRVKRSVNWITDRQAEKKISFLAKKRLKQSHSG